MAQLYCRACGGEGIMLRKNETHCYMCGRGYKANPPHEKFADVLSFATTPNPIFFTPCSVDKPDKK